MNHRQNKTTIITTFLLFFSCSLILLAGWPATGSAARQTPLIGAQISLLKPQTRSERRYLFAQLRTSGFNTIIVRVFQNHHDRYHHFDKLNSPAPLEGVYFNTDQVPVIGNLLPNICRDAHAEGLKVFAWMTTLHANYHRPQLPKTYIYNQQNHCLQLTGALDPTARENREFLLDLYRDLAAYPIDGIMFQDDMILKCTEGFHPGGDGKGLHPDPAALYHFTADGSHISGYQPAFWQWCSNKARTLQTLNNEIMAACRHINPDLLFAQNIHYETLLTPRWGKAWFAEIPEVLQSSTADYFFIMAYQQQIRRELNLKDDRELEKIMNRLFDAGKILERGKQQVVFKLQAVDWKSGSPVSGIRMTSFLRLLKKNHRDSVIIMPYNENLFAHSIGVFSSHRCRQSAQKINVNLLPRWAESGDNISNDIAGGIGADEGQAENPPAPGFHQLTADNVLSPPVSTLDQDIRFKQCNEL
ncbi:MAG: hypothetical protein DRH04_05825 [Deltaproteobacteria bacterium]|nr:MAG: hypothetical protein DRH04_05825 [Deltaproteobacteria bacterium]